MADLRAGCVPKSISVVLGSSSAPGGRISIQYEGLDLPNKTFGKSQKVGPAAIVENKRLAEVLAYVAERQNDFGQETRSKKVLLRRGQARINPSIP